MKKIKLSNILNTKESIYKQDYYYFSIIINKKYFIIFICFILIIIIFKIILRLIIKKELYKNYINVAYGFDKNYHYITHVSMKSIMLSQNKETFINFYLLVSNITDEQRTVINRISLEHTNCQIQYLDLGNSFKELRVPSDIWTTANFYRIILQDLLQNETKILYLDCDTLVYKDLTKLYNYNITDKLYTGMAENYNDKFLKKYNLTVKNYINTGVILCNLEELRKRNISQKIIDFIIKYNKSLEFPVNDPTNYITNENNGYFSPEYVVIGFCNITEPLKYYNNSKVKVNITEVIKSYKDPYIYHFMLHLKPWRAINKYHGYVCFDPITRFYEIARKTSYYFDILDEFLVKY